MINIPITMVRKARVGVVAAALILVAACGGGGAASNDASDRPAVGQPQKGGTLEIALNADPATLDWTSTSAVVTRSVAWNIFEQLFALDKNYDVRPMLADSFSTAEDKLSYTINLREGIAFHDGSQFDAEDVVASLKRWGVVSGAGIEAFSRITSVTAENPTTVQIKLDSPFTPLITSFADVRQAAIMMPSEIADAAGSDAMQDNQIIGTGPYKFASREPGSLITLERFEDYSSLSENWGGLAGAKAAYLDTLKYNIVTDEQVRLNGVQTDLYHFAVNIPQDLYEQVKTIPTARPFIVSPYAWLAFVFNKAEPPFDDVRLRQAVAYALKLEQIGAAAVGNEDLYELNPSIFFEEQEALYTTEGTELYNVQDVEKAKALMREAGYDGTPIRLLTTKDYPEFYKAAVAVASQLEDVGFTVEIQVFDWPTVLERRKDAAAYEIFTTTSSPSFDPTSMTWMVPGAWPGFYESPAMEELLDQWAATSDPGVQQDLLAEMNRVVYTEVPEIKGPVLSALYVGADGLEGYPNWMDATFWNAWLSGGQ